MRKLWFKNGRGKQKELWFGNTLVIDGGYDKVCDCFSTARSVLDKAGVSYLWEHDGAYGRSNLKEGCVIEEQKPCPTRI